MSGARPTDQALVASDEAPAASSQSSIPSALVVCSFCDKNQDQVTRIITGPSRVAICQDCVALCCMICVAEVEAGNSEPLWLTRTRPMDSHDIIKSIVRELRQEDAQAIEAQRAETPQSGFVHESASHD